jgi:hypothetical protein
MVAYVCSRVDYTPAHPPDKHQLSLLVCEPWTLKPDGPPELPLRAAVKVVLREGGRKTSQQQMGGRQEDAMVRDQGTTVEHI